VKARGTARPHHEIKYIRHYTPSSGVRISGVTKEIIERYFEYKKRSSTKREFTRFVNRIREWLGF
jgi:hypothetical protein